MKKSLLLVLLLSFIAGNAKLYNSRYALQNKEIKETPYAVFIGNSITRNWAKLDTTFFVENNFLGRGISGETSIEILSRFKDDVVSFKPKFAVIMAGTNDIAENRGIVSDEHIIANIRMMTEMAIKNGISPIICSIPPCNYFRWRKDLKPAERIKRVNVLIREFAKEKGIPYVDYHSAITDSEGALPAKFTKDGCHPNVECYRIMEGIILKEINKQSK